MLTKVRSFLAVVCLVLACLWSLAGCQLFRRLFGSSAYTLSVATTPSDAGSVVKSPDRAQYESFSEVQPVFRTSRV